MFKVFQENHPLGGEASGFQMTFENGYEISIVWGYGRYGDGEKAAEVAIFTPSGELFGGDVDGWQSPEDIVRIMQEVAAR